PDDVGIVPNNAVATLLSTVGTSTSSPPACNQPYRECCKPAYRKNPHTALRYVFNSGVSKVWPYSLLNEFPLSLLPHLETLRLWDNSVWRYGYCQKVKGPITTYEHESDGEFDLDSVDPTTKSTLCSQISKLHDDIFGNADGSCDDQVCDIAHRAGNNIYRACTLKIVQTPGQPEELHRFVH